MIKVFALFMSLVLLPLTTHAANFDHAANFEEGNQYQVIKQTATTTPQVTEYFSFYCPHCKAFEPYINDLKVQLPDNVKFNKNHVNFLGGEMAVELTKAYAAAELLEVEDKVAELLFDSIHVKHKVNYSENDLLDIFEQAGVDRKEAESTLQSFAVNGIASQMKRNTEVSGVRGVPTVIVNGKYQINRGKLKTEQEFIDLVNFLLKKKG